MAVLKAIGWAFFALVTFSLLAYPWGWAALIIVVSSTVFWLLNKRYRWIEKHDRVGQHQAGYQPPVYWDGRGWAYGPPPAPDDWYTPSAEPAVPEPRGRHVRVE